MHSLANFKGIWKMATLSLDVPKYHPPISHWRKPGISNLEVIIGHDLGDP